MYVSNGAMNMLHRSSHILASCMSVVFLHLQIMTHKKLGFNTYRWAVRVGVVMCNVWVHLVLWYWCK